MNIKTFIDRPILAGVISVMILLLGLIGLLQLPVEQFPEIAPPTVSVSAASVCSGSGMVTPVSTDFAVQISGRVSIKSARIAAIIK